MKLLQVEYAVTLFRKLFCTLSPITAHNFIPYKEIYQFSCNPESSIKSKSQEKVQLRKPNSNPSVVSCSSENTAHGECVMLHNDSNST
jgi:hypothetical protein